MSASSLSTLLAAGVRSWRLPALVARLAGAGHDPAAYSAAALDAADTWLDDPLDDPAPAGWFGSSLDLRLGLDVHDLGPLEWAAAWEGRPAEA